MAHGGRLVPGIGLVDLGWLDLDGPENRLGQEFANLHVLADRPLDEFQAHAVGFQRFLVLGFAAGLVVLGLEGLGQLVGRDDRLGVGGGREQQLALADLGGLLLDDGLEPGGVELSSAGRPGCRRSP